MKIRPVYIAMDHKAKSLVQDRLVSFQVARNRRSKFTSLIYGEAETLDMAKVAVVGTY
jgi:hypothetical protein